MTLTEIRAVLAARGLAPLKQLGQNFLHDQNLAAWLADRAVADVPPGAEIVEIGPGLGALTSLLLAKNLRLTALERDRGLCTFLREKFQAEIAEGRLDLQEGDALALLPALKIAPAVVCGNLPYYISTPLLMECLRLPGAPARLFFLMQKEVGQRLAGGPGSKAYGALSVQVQVGHQVALLRSLPGSVFYPPPEVSSIGGGAAGLFPAPQEIVEPAPDFRHAPGRAAWSRGVGRIVAGDSRRVWVNSRKSVILSSSKDL
jgi:16S rRNA (adenine1518-N6/adenine1519-N6)-dimethyltransferase